MTIFPKLFPAAQIHPPKPPFAFIAYSAFSTPFKSVPVALFHKSV
jgi:hypothetical protein